jgi:Phage gp6-like head-tail connector protein
MAPTIISAVTVPAVTQFDNGQPLDLIDLADIKLELNINNTQSDAWLAKVITRASRAISTACTRVFQPQGYQEQFWAFPGNPYPWQLPGGFFPLQLSAWPLSSAPSLAGTTPPLAPTLIAGSGGSLSAGKYYARLTYVTPNGETAASQEVSVTVGASGSILVTAPIEDFYAAATGWKIYVGTASFGETLQNSSPQPMYENFTLTSYTTTGAVVPNYILVVENYPNNPQPLAEGIDFISDYNAGPSPDLSKGWLTRLFQIDETPRRWSAIPILVQYQAGYPDIPDDLSDATLQLVKAKYFARNRDPKLRSENVVGAYEATWWFASGPGAEGEFPPDVQAVIDRYRVPTIA